MCRFRRILSWYRPTSIDFIVKEKQDTNTKKNSEYQKQTPYPTGPPLALTSWSMYLVSTTLHRSIKEPFLGRPVTNPSSLEPSGPYLPREKQREKTKGRLTTVLYEEQDSYVRLKVRRTNQCPWWNSKNLSSPLSFSFFCFSSS